MKSSLHISTATRKNRTVLKNYFSTQPLTLANISEGGNEDQLKLVIMSSSPGILDGDEFDIKIEVADNCNLHLETQSYQRLFQMQQGASQLFVVKVGKAASFEYLPHPVVPHIISKFSAKNEIYLSRTSKLTWAEVIACGRKLNNEVFDFSYLHNLTTIFIDSRLVITENLLIKPLVNDIKGIGHFEGYTHQASLIHINDEANTKEIVSLLHATFGTSSDYIFGVSTLPVNGIIIRLLGNKAEQLFNIVKEAAALLRTTNKDSNLNQHLHVA